MTKEQLKKIFPIYSDSVIYFDITNKAVVHLDSRKYFTKPLRFHSFMGMKGDHANTKVYTYNPRGKKLIARDPVVGIDHGLEKHLQFF